MCRQARKFCGGVLRKIEAFSGWFTSTIAEFQFASVKITEPLSELLGRASRDPRRHYCDCGALQSVRDTAEK
jgi:hypothetical protein